MDIMKVADENSRYHVAFRVFLRLNLTVPTEATSHEF